MRTTHELKILPVHFDSIIKGKKTFEIIYNDRNYKVGDILVLREYKNKGYSGCKVTVEITYILENFEGIKNGYIALGFKILKVKI